MKHLKVFALVLLSLALFTGAANAQRKTRKTSAKKPTVTNTVIPPLDVRVARGKVDTQLSDLNGFIDKLSQIAPGLETADADAKAGKLSASTREKVETAKAKAVDSIRNLKTALSNLESEFRTKTVLQKYLPTIQGITDLVAQSEDSAIAGHFVAAKEPLRQASKKLTDTLAVLPVSPPQ